MRMMKVLTAVALVVAVLAMAQTPASAHRDCNYDGRDRACVGPRHLHATVCDNERDGKLVTGIFKLVNGEWVEGSDRDGKNDSCALLQFSVEVEEFAVCETGNDCDLEWP